MSERLDALLETFETQLLEAAQADSQFVSEASTHIIAAGGKRFRPMLVFLSAEVGEREADQADLLRAAMVMELTHVASLYHDDVMDEADVRRGTPSANRYFGNSVAILVGDFLFAQASKLVALLGKDYILLQAETFARLVQGQIAETRGPGEGEDPLAHYLKVIADKTGSLIAASAQFGGMVADVSDEVRSALAAYGEEVGLVFQLSDDLLDILSDDSGKTPGTDLREGVPTLPVLMLSDSDDPADRALLARIQGDLSDDAVLADVLADLRAHPVIDRARAEVRRRADIAKAHLAALPDGEVKDTLSRVPDTLVDRTT
ncbi:polyprenyl synthetase family protein [Tessaracoccus sp. HF-7]|nr:polyprenyl synthetase family protein [Tessaracoccus caeni]MDF1487047.1 polyprenyl synthetase family protein [Tessaracoccus caeni]